MVATGFCVYEHVRLDTQAVFYVGKGQRERPWRHTSRNRYWTNVVNLSGFEVRIVFTTECEELAFFVEEELIAKHRRAGAKLVNMTDGGEGPKGRRRKQTPEEIARRRAANTGRRRTPEQCARIAAARKGRGIGRKLSEDHRAKIGAALIGRNIPMVKLRGRARPEHVVRALVKANDARFSERRDLIKTALRDHPDESAAAIARRLGCDRGTVSKFRRLLIEGAL
jgi:hypothetical protein